ncbi:hypothetical protein CRD60_02855 [Bifidobacterium aemilianum]|uniref:Septum formation initiator family protein n=1 Tax=Bifidobacterium aemilianum TaxID=2493120 RepID=A0A366KAU1_9BIFI|nr:DUF501 domain-containing protein [Bifidobacterium aemilianum]RBP98278.1 hypothetical protein CRD60_02855 [Bifidobacterium aemilianum]
MNPHDHRTQHSDQADLTHSGQGPEPQEERQYRYRFAGPEFDWVRQLADHLLEQPLDPRDQDLVTRQLGRFPRGMLAVGARCACGKPLAVITRPVLPGGIPFPTSCYLTSPEAVKAVSQLEGQGIMRDYANRLAEDPDLAQAYGHAHELYLAFRQELARLTGDGEEHIAGISAGGMPDRVKCLHALLAQGLVMGPGSNPIADMTLAAIEDQFDAAVCRCSLDYEDTETLANTTEFGLEVGQ